MAESEIGIFYIRGQGVQENKIVGIALLLTSATIDNSPENQVKE